MTLSPTLSPVPPEVTTTCLLITTGTGNFDNGFIDVFVDSGAGYVEVTTPSIKYAQGQVVLDVTNVEHLGNIYRYASNLSGLKRYL